MSRKKDNEEITSKEDHFCREYICDAAENQTRAYLRVWPSATYGSAAVQSHNLLKKVKIRQRIDELKTERNKRLEVDADKVLKGLAKLSFYDPRNLFDADGRLKPIGELEPDDAYVIAGIETIHKVSGEDDDGITITSKIKLPDKGQNLERLGRHLKLFTDKAEITGDNGTPLTFIMDFSGKN